VTLFRPAAARSSLLAGDPATPPAGANSTQPKHPVPRAVRHSGHPHPATLRTLCELVILLLVALLIARTWLVEGFVVPSGSMAETLCGNHRRVTCQECRFEFACGSDQPATPTALCPNCAFDQTPLESAPEARGDRVLVAKSAFQFRAPRRFEVVAFRRQHESGRVYVKRVVGLPGEQVQLVGGELYINSNIQRKSLHQQRALAILVHDARHIPSAKLIPPRWTSDQPDTRWQSTAGSFSHPAGNSPDVDWLTYHHVTRAPGFAALIHAAPIQDEYGYNQRGSARGDFSHDVRDLLLAARLSTQGNGTLHLRFDDGRDRFTWQLEPSTGRAQLIHNDQTVAELSHPRLQRLATGTTLLECSVIDRQCLLALDGQLLGDPYLFDTIDLPTPPSSRPLAVGAQQLAVQISELQLFRDVYYTRPRSLKTWALDGPYQLDAGEYFVLGDNSPQSDDSRLWLDGPAILQELLVGKPICVHLPTRAIDLGWGHIQVPDTARVRYIR